MAFIPEGIALVQHIYTRWPKDRTSYEHTSTSHLRTLDNFVNHLLEPTVVSACLWICKEQPYECGAFLAHASGAHKHNADPVQVEMDEVTAQILEDRDIQSMQELQSSAVVRTAKPLDWKAQPYYPVLIQAIAGLASNNHLQNRLDAVIIDKDRLDSSTQRRRFWLPLLLQADIIPVRNESEMLHLHDFQLCQTTILTLATLPRPDFAGTMSYLEHLRGLQMEQKGSRAAKNARNDANGLIAFSESCHKVSTYKSMAEAVHCPYIGPLVQRNIERRSDIVALKAQVFVKKLVGWKLGSGGGELGQVFMKKKDEKKMAVDPSLNTGLFEMLAKSSRKLRAMYVEQQPTQVKREQKARLKRGVSTRPFLPCAPIRETGAAFRDAIITRVASEAVRAAKSKSRKPVDRMSLISIPVYKKPPFPARPVRLDGEACVDIWVRQNSSS